jgi:hypothetical protein
VLKKKKTTLRFCLTPWQSSRKQTAINVGEGMVEGRETLYIVCGNVKDKYNIFSHM